MRFPPTRVRPEQKYREEHVGVRSGLDLTGYRFLRKPYERIAFGSERMPVMNFLDCDLTNSYVVPDHHAYGGPVCSNLLVAGADLTGADWFLDAASGSYRLYFDNNTVFPQGFDPAKARDLIHLTMPEDRTYKAFDDLLRATERIDIKIGTTSVLWRGVSVISLLVALGAAGSLIYQAF